MQRSTIYKISIIAVAALAVAYLLFSVVFFSRKQKNITCSNVEIILLDKSKVELIKELDIEKFLIKQNLYPLGKSLRDISTEAIEKSLSTSEMIKSSECYITPSGVAYIKISQRIPKFRVIGKENYYIDTERKRIKASGDYTAYVPVVTGYVNEETAKDGLYDFISFIEKNSFWNAQIEQIYITPNGKVELVPRVGDCIILLGTLDNFDSKLEKLKKLYTNAFNTIGWNHYKTIDLQYRGQIVCTKH